jgi:hypothetical protein
MKILILFLEWDIKKSKNVQTFLNSFMKSFTKIDWTFVKITNYDESQPWQRINNSHHFLVGGDNSFQEFSGWDKGWQQCKKNLNGNYDLVLTCNDALLNSKPINEILQLKYWHLNKALQENYVIGWVDTFSRVWRKPDQLCEMEIFGNKTKDWLCTAFMISPSIIFEKVIPLLSFTKLNKVFFEEFNSKLFLQNCGLGESYRNFLIDHQNKIWYRSYEINKSSYPLFRSKTSMCINEHLLGIRLKQVDCNFLSLSDLSNLDKQRLAENKLKSLYEQGLKNIALYGAGKHSNWLNKINLGGLTVTALLDDSDEVNQTLWNLPILHPKKFSPSTVDAVILSSDTFQNDMAQRLRKIWKENSNLVDLYS